ncbi:hypothetical protein GJ496_002798 [Pomphorhynchus laevis]|nr:hypothetical protein GJ496_002798 [Pomphorhynchus laevis]
MSARRLIFGVANNSCNFIKISILGMHSSANQSKSVILKTPKGMRDNSGYCALTRQRIIDVLSECCKAHDAELLDSPHLELKEVLDSKYGEEQKLIYNLEDFEGERLSLRYDLTVPFARYLASNKIVNMRRFQYGKVFRRDNPKMNRGRLREFFQFDFDIAGDYDRMVPDSECLLLVVEALEKLNINFIIKVNHRRLLEGILYVCGVDQDKLKSVCSSIDKLDKRPWSEVRDELVRIKNIPESVVDSIGKHITMKGSIDQMDMLLNSDTTLIANSSILAGIEDLKTLSTFLRAFGIDQKVVFDLSLARGLDYYTGLIYEAVLTDYDLKDSKTGEDISIGSVAAGGRYDGLVSGFTTNPKEVVPCVGVSFGVERLATIIERQTEKDKYRPVETEIYIASPQKGFIIERMKLTKHLINAGFKVGFCPKQKAKFLTQLQYCEAKHIPICVVISQNEIDNEQVKVRMVQSREEADVDNSDLIDFLTKALKKHST